MSTCTATCAYNFWLKKASRLVFLRFWFSGCHAKQLKSNQIITKLIEVSKRITFVSILGQRLGGSAQGDVGDNERVLRQVHHALPLKVTLFFFIMEQLTQ